ALYKHPDVTETVILISHYDTVPTEEYGDLEPLACKPVELTEAMHSVKDELDDAAREDLESGDYLFGRGTMDMKSGLALHMGLIEKASTEGWPVNLVRMSVADEEVSSAGMRYCVNELLELEKEYDLTYTLSLNSEPFCAM